MEQEQAAPGSRPWLAALLCLFIPWLGHAYCGLYKRAACFFVGTFAAFLAVMWVIYALVPGDASFAWLYYFFVPVAAWDVYGFARAASPLEAPPNLGPVTVAVVARRGLAWLQVICFVLIFPTLLAILFFVVGFAIAIIVELGGGASLAALFKAAASLGVLLLGGALVWALYRSANATLQVATGRTPADSWRKAVNPWIILLTLIFAAIAVDQFSHLMRMSAEGVCRGNLRALRSAVALYHEGKGEFPAEIPPAKTPRYHPDSSAIRRAASPDDAGGWLYDDVPGDAGFGKVWVNCTHTDSKGRAWSAY